MTLRKVGQDLLLLVENHTNSDVTVQPNQVLGTMISGPVLNSSDPQFEKLRKKYMNRSDTDEKVDYNMFGEENQNEENNINILPEKTLPEEIDQSPEKTLTVKENVEERFRY